MITELSPAYPRQDVEKRAEFNSRSGSRHAIDARQAVKTAVDNLLDPRASRTQDAH